MQRQEIINRLDDLFLYDLEQVFKYWDLRNGPEARKYISRCIGVAESAFYLDILWLGDLDQIIQTMMDFYNTIVLYEFEEFSFFDLGERVI